MQKIEAVQLNSTQADTDSLRFVRFFMMDDIVHHELEDTEYNALTRVVVICLDEETGESVFQWSVSNLINPQVDMVVLVHVRPSEHFTTPYGNQTDYLIKIAERHRDESHTLLKRYGAQLTAKKV